MDVLINSNFTHLPLVQHAIALFYISKKKDANNFLLWAQKAAANGFAQSWHTMGHLYVQGMGEVTFVFNLIFATGYFFDFLIRWRKISP